jgi:hypothetical protein
MRVRAVLASCTRARGGDLSTTTAVVAGCCRWTVVASGHRMSIRALSVNHGSCPIDPCGRDSLQAPYTSKKEHTMPSPADREKALETALAQIDRQFGKGSVMRLGSDERAPVATIPTGSVALDVALGIGGLPRGRIVEIYGPESSGKTTLTLHAIANAQRAGARRCRGRRRGRPTRSGWWRRHRERTARGRHRGLHRRGARARPGVRQEARRRHRRTPRLPAGHR